VRSEGGIAVSPSGATMVFSDCGSKESLIDVVDDVKRPVIDDDHALRPAFGPDKRLAYVHGSGDGGALMVRDPQGVTSELLRVRGRITDVAFAEDGDHLAYAVADLTTPGIYVTALTNPIASNRVTEDPGDTAPSILAETIYFTRTGTDGVPHAMRVAMFGGTPEPVLTRPRRVLDVDVRTQRVLLSAPGNDYLYWWDPATGRETAGPSLRAGEPFIDVAISPDGRWVLFVIGGTGQVIRRLRLDGKSQIEDVTTLSGDTNSVSGTIDNRGHPLLAISRWAGELWRIDAPEGTRW